MKYINIATVASIGFGLILGILYGLLFMYQHTLPTRSTKKAIVLAAVNVARLLSFAAIWYFILKTPFLKSILVLIAFFISFWGIILSVKGRR